MEETNSADIEKLSKEAASLSEEEKNILVDLHNTLFKEPREHIMKERHKIREKHPRLEPFFGLAAPEMAKIIDKIKK